MNMGAILHTQSDSLLTLDKGISSAFAEEVCDRNNTALQEGGYGFYLQLCTHL